MEVTRANMGTPSYDYFSDHSNVCHRQYDALRAFFYEGIQAERVAKQYGYTIHAMYNLIKDFKALLKASPVEDPFFLVRKTGRKSNSNTGEITSLIIQLRKQYLSTPDIKIILDAKGLPISERHITTLIKAEGFARLPRRSKQSKAERLTNVPAKVVAPKSQALDKPFEEFSSHGAGLLCLLPYLQKYGIDKAIANSGYPETSVINKQASIYSFLALKTSNIRRYSADDLWCMDRGTGMFAGLNTLPKTAWYTSYSDRVTRDMNVSFLKSIHKIWKQHQLLSDSMNLDFTTIPYWGDDTHLENNWSGKRGKGLASMLAVLAQDPDSGILDYGDTQVRHKDEPQTVLEFLDFYREGKKTDRTLRYLVFDNKFTNRENLNRLNLAKIKFVTIRSRGKSIVDKLNQIPAKSQKQIRVMCANGKGRILKVLEEKIQLEGYAGDLRQVAILRGHGKIKPALVITNDFEISVEDLIRKYSRRWLVEKGISEQIEFFHLNRVSSSMVIKVDFDLTMSILAHNLYRLFAQDLEGYAHCADMAIYEKFLNNSGAIKMTPDSIHVALKKKRNLPLLLTSMQKFQNMEIHSLGNRKIFFSGLSSS
jgi:transposase